MASDTQPLPGAAPPSGGPTEDIVVVQRRALVFAAQANEGRRLIRDYERRLTEAQQRLEESRQRVRTFDQERTQNASAVEALRVQLRSIQDSTSWRIMEPARRIAGRHPTLATIGRRLAKLVWWTLTLQLASKVRIVIETRRQRRAGPRRSEPAIGP
jgi:hypothetical protein